LSTWLDLILATCIAPLSRTMVVAYDWLPSHPRRDTDIFWLHHRYVNTLQASKHGRSALKQDVTSG
jgi:hypothetical protein